MPGIEVFSRINFGKETTKGSAVARTRRFYGVAAGNFDIGDVYNYHEAENRGQKVRPSGRTPTLIREVPTLKLQDSDGIAYDDLVSHQGRVGAREAGKARSEGKDYIVRDGDVILFFHN